MSKRNDCQNYYDSIKNSDAYTEEEKQAAYSAIMDNWDD